MEFHIRLGRRHLVVLAVLAAAVVGGVAYAAIPDAGGVYTACKLNATGTIRLIDPSLGASNLLGHCTALESKITWNKVGQAGASPTVVQLAVGDANCPAGGAAITDASGTTAYVCNGRPFSGSFQSPNGQYALQVSDQRVAVSGPGAGLSIAGGTLGLTANNEVMTVANDRADTVGGDDTLSVGANRTESVGASESTSIGKDRLDEVAGNATDTIGKDRSDDVAGNAVETIGKSRSERVGQDETITIGRNRADTVDGDETTTVGGDRSDHVAGNETVHVDGSKIEKDGVDYQHEAGRSFTFKAGTDGLIQANGTLQLRAAFINDN